MIVREATFVKSSADHRHCPGPDIPEYAFIGRSNVGKSSLINMITGNRKLAKISGTPGKTQLINHFIVNGGWYLVDLPGYGFARISKKVRGKWEKMIQDYFLHRENLVSTFILLDSRLVPQASDMQFIRWFGEHSIPFVLLLTKADKLGTNQLHNSVRHYQERLLEEWEELPMSVVTSAKSGQGRDEILNLIEEMNTAYRNGVGGG